MTMTAESIFADLKQLDTMLQRWAWEAEKLQEELHTCPESHLRHPWPFRDPNCKACLIQIDKFARRFHLEIPYLLFGREVMEQHYRRAIQIKIDQREARLQMGAFI